MNQIIIKQIVTFAKKIEHKHTNDKNYCKVFYWAFRGATKRICYLKYSIPKEILVLFHNGFMASSVSNHVDNLAEGIHKVKCKYVHDKWKTWNIWNCSKYIDVLVELNR